MRNISKSILLERAKQLRSNMTKEEKILWQALRAKRFCQTKFKRQKVISGYIVDFVAIAEKLIIELDGSQHLEQQEYDQNRTEVLNQQGFNVIRFWNSDILYHLKSVLDFIFEQLEQQRSILKNNAK